MQDEVVGTIALTPSVTNLAYAVNFFKDLGGPGDKVRITAGSADVSMKIRKIQRKKDAVTASNATVSGADSATTGGAGALMLAVKARTSEDLGPLSSLVDYLEVVFSSNLSASGVYFTLLRHRDNHGYSLYEATPS